LGKQFDSTQAYDRNIRFKNNQIRTFGTRIIWADQVDGLEIIDNTILQSDGPIILHSDAPAVDFIHCSDVRFEGNVYRSSRKASISYDAQSGKTLVLMNNEGFSSP
jgi:hypothetical protein